MPRAKVSHQKRKKEAVADALEQAPRAFGNLRDCLYNKAYTIKFMTKVPPIKHEKNELGSGSIRAAKCPTKTSSLSHRSLN